jgi:plastocyanin
MDRPNHGSLGIQLFGWPTLAGTAAVLLFSLAAVTRAEEPARNADRPTGRGGSLTGSVEVGPELSSRKMRFNLYTDFVQPAVAAGQPTREEELRNVVIYLEATPPGAAVPPPSTAPFRMRQENSTFLPHVLAVQRGSTVEFPNSDPIFHNVFSLSKAASFDLGRFPRGEAKSVRFDKAGLVKVFCHIHSDMSAVIMVRDNPFFATPDSNGRFRIDGIPSGTYRAVGWHERARPQVHDVRIEPGQPAVVHFRIPLTGPVSSE